MKKIFYVRGFAMAYCVKCGTLITGEDLFCPMCGTKTEFDDETVSEAPVETAASVMTKEESIAFAEKLGETYKSYERLKKEIEDNKMQLSKPEPGMVKRHAAFKFFWPYLVAAAVTFNVLYFIGSLLNNTSGSGAALFFYALALIVSVIILIVGGTTARRLRDEYNQTAIMAANNRRKHLDELKHETSALERKAAKKASELKEYQSIIPLPYRDSASMAKVVILLRSNKAETFTEAVELLRKV